MKTLTTRSQPALFVEDLHRVANEFERFAHNLPKLHVSDRGNYKLGRPNDVPDTEAFFTGFSMLLVQLYSIVESMIELEDSLEDMDDDDAEDVAHTLGEIFAMKTVYLSIVDSVRGLEDSRVRASSRGLSSRDFFFDVRREGGTPSEKSLDRVPHQFFPTTTNTANYLTQTMPPKWVTDLKWTPDFKI